MLTYHVELVPTEYAIRMRPVFILSLVALVVLVIGKFTIRDFWGAISLIFVVLMGLLVITGEYRINASSACFFAVMAIVMAIFDVISCVLYFQHSRYKVGDPEAPLIVLLAQTVFVVSPVLLTLSAFVSYSIFVDCNEHAQELWHRDDGVQSYDALGVGHMGQASAGGGWWGQGQQPPARQAPPPFQGQGRRLDGND